MALPWIQVDTSLPDKAVVMHVKRACNCSANEAIGLIVRVLCWADGVTADGVCRGFRPEDVDEHFGASFLAVGLLNAGWIYQNEEGWVVFSKWGEEHNGDSTKKRNQNTKRVSKHRERKRAEAKCNATCNADVTHNALQDETICSADVTTERNEMRYQEREREYKSANALNAGARACEDFSLLDNLREAWPKGAKATAKLKQTWREVLAEGVTPYELMACFERQRLSNQWQQEYPRYVPTLQKWLDERGFKEELRILRAERKKAQESRAERLGEEDYPELSQSDLNSVFD
jgi:hypothetical protein